MLREFLKKSLKSMITESFNELFDSLTIEDLIYNFSYFTNITLTYVNLYIYTDELEFISFFYHLKRIIYPTAFVFSCLVTIQFWSLFFINPYLVKKNFNGNITLYIIFDEFGVHLFPPIYLHLERTDFKLKWSLRDIRMIFTFFVFYFIILEFLYVYKNYVVYNFFKEISFLSKLIWLIIVQLTAYSVYYINIRLDDIFS
ncbi:hypothetical protein A0H76_2599 [Hepatospora eriocheir]|uniref:Uncharacterized protein n=1 Tax=Hepatospora eriocheir TaxID=1081669 RepID=A0A1X0QJN8_9MICR|nr:hypothetical protein A0H76_2599 [Hepatospora eriocheir]